MLNQADVWIHASIWVLTLMIVLFLETQPSKPVEFFLIVILYPCLVSKLIEPIPSKCCVFVDRLLKLFDPRRNLKLESSQKFKTVLISDQSGFFSLIISKTRVKFVETLLSELIKPYKPVSPHCLLDAGLLVIYHALYVLNGLFLF